MSWGLIPWSQLAHRQMTYRKLLQQLQSLPGSTLDQTVTLYSIADDEFVPAYMRITLTKRVRFLTLTISLLPSDDYFQSTNAQRHVKM